MDVAVPTLPITPPNARNAGSTLYHSFASGSSTLAAIPPQKPGSSAAYMTSS